MAGAGKKIFVQGNVLNASEVNTYLMDQAVMVFADATARDTALPNGTRAEGMTCYLKDVDTIYVYTGSAWVAIAAATGSLGAWTGYTPSLTNMTLGNGTSSCTYIQIGKTVHVRGRLAWGSTTSVAGQISLSLPVTAVSSNFVANVTVRAGGVDYGAYFASTTTTLALSALGAAGTYVNRVTSSATVPGTWGSGDNITFSATYEAA